MHLIGGNKKEETDGVFIRMEARSIELGLAVIYKVQNCPFQIIAHREGVQVIGQFPNTNRGGIDALTAMLYRAVAHHEHLATFPVGTAQVPLPEEMVAVGDPKPTSLLLSDVKPPVV